MEYIELETTPSDETCVQVKSGTDYMPAMRAEALRTMALLDGRFPDIEGYFALRSCPHDFGDYLEIRYYFEDSEEGWLDANFVESNWPRTWDDTEPAVRLGVTA
jgi:hypothetical protein